MWVAKLFETGRKGVEWTKFLLGLEMTIKMEMLPTLYECRRCHQLMGPST